MGTFWTIWLISAMLNLAVIRGMIYTKVCKPHPGNMLVVFLPIVNMVCSIGFIIMGTIMGLCWITNGTIDVD